MRSKQWTIGLVVAVLGLFSLSCSASGNVSVGSSAPDFTLTSSKGKQLRLEGFRGRPVLLNFFTTWCGPCRSEMPGMQSAYETYGPQGLVLVAVDLGDSPEDVGAYRDELGLDFPLLIDQESRVGSQYGVSSYPRTFFIDRDGVIRKISFGSMEEGEIRAGVEDLLARPSAKQISQPDTSQGGVEGCINIASARAHTGPGKKYPAELQLYHGDCYTFDGRSSDAAWLRLAGLVSAQGNPLWVSAEFVDLKADVKTLPVEK